MLFLDLPRMLTEEEENELLGRIQEESARRQLIEGNLRLVGYIANKFASSRQEDEEFFSIGAIGLIKAIRSFNPEKGIKLATYATRCIENEILMYLRASNKWKDDISLETPLNKDSEGNEQTLEDIMEDERADFEEVVSQREKLCETISRVLNNLDSKEKYCLLKFAAGEEQPKIGKEIGISQGYVSRLLKRARNNLYKKKRPGRYCVEQETGIYTVKISYPEPELLKYINTCSKNLNIKCCEREGRLDITFLQFDKDCYGLLADIVRYIEM